MSDCPILHFTELDSTNRYCLREAAALASGTAVVADKQTVGRGQHGREWLSPPGVNLYVSVLFRPPLPTAAPVLLPQLCALAVRDALRDFGIAEPQLRWPNDVWVSGAKIAGVLCESSWRGATLEALVAGLGVNLNTRAEQLAPLGRPATSVLLCTGHPVKRAEFLDTLLTYLHGLWAELWRDGGHAAHERWRQALDLEGRHVTIARDHERWRGRVEELAFDGGLRLRLADGRQQRFWYGEASLDLGTSGA